MSRIIDEDVVGPIKTHVATDAYREGWDRVFGEKSPIPPEIQIGSGQPMSWRCGHCGAEGIGGVHGCEGLGRYVVDFDAYARR